MKNLRKAREAKKYTQKELADLLGFDPMTISNYENLKTNPDIETLIKLSKLLEVSTDYLVGLTQEKTISQVKVNLDKLSAPEVKEILIKILEIITLKL